jgi:hypothetical protein
VGRTSFRRGSVGRGGKVFFFLPPCASSLNSFHKILIVEFGRHLPT